MGDTRKFPRRASGRAQSKTALRYGADGVPKTHVATRAGVATGVTLAVVLALTVFTFVRMDYGKADMGVAVASFFKQLGVMAFQAGPVNYTFAELLDALWVSVGLSILSTVYGSLIALVLALFASANLTNKRISNAIKGVMVVIRAVPTILWVMVFAVAIRLGSEAAVVGMACHSVAFLTKAYSEAFEEADPKVLEALRSTGASWWQVVFRGVFVDKMPEILSWTFIRFESNFRNAVSVGALVGAGGIGYNLIMSGRYLLSMREVGLIVYMCLAVSIVLEIVATLLRNRYLETEEQKAQGLWRRIVRQFVEGHE